MRMDRLSPEYRAGVNDFIKVATQDARRRKLKKIFCPCEICVNHCRKTESEVRYDLFRYGIDQSYTCWTKHGENLHAPHASSCTVNFETHTSTEHEFEEGPLGDIPDSTIDDAPDYVAEATKMVDAILEDFPGDRRKFEKLIEDAKKPLFPGDSKLTKLSAIIKLYNLKAKHGVSDKFFGELLDLLKNEMLPDGNEIPSSTYEAKKSINPLGLNYVKIHVCPNDCILYRKDHEKKEVCPTCGESRWKKDKITLKECKGVPVKVLWYFPIIPRLKRLFLVKYIARKLIWHDRDRNKDGLLRHPADAEAWKAIDERYPDFAEDPRNIRLGVSADGVNPFRGKKKSYSCWPILTVVYNLPPSLCMKRKFMMLTMLIQGPKEPGNDIDVFLAPFIDDLKLLFDEGVEAYDAYKQERFTLRAVVLWTISDYPALGNLSGCTVGGYDACATCGVNTHSTWLKYSKKVSYTGHRKWLPSGHRYRYQMKPFDGNQEFGVAPEPVSGLQRFEEAKSIENAWGKKGNGGRTLGKSTRSEFEDEDSSNLKKLSIWAKELEYFKYNLVQHNFDLMHIEKNVCESLVGTLLNDPLKTKDGYKARMDLNDLKIRPELEPVVAGKRMYLPPACYTLTKEEKVKFCKTLYELKVPQGYCSNFSSLVSLKDSKLIGLKSHDYHVLMQQFLPLAVRSILPKNVRNTIIRLSSFFKSICKKEIDIVELDNIQRDLVETLCLLEKYFPPSFFTIMIHLTVHLVREVKLCGPVFTRWMYPFERYMKILKGYIRNKNRAEGCIVNCNELEEFVEFAADWLSGVETIGIPPLKYTGASSSEGSSIISDGKPLQGAQEDVVDGVLLSQAHLVVLHNTEEVKPYIEYVLLFFLSYKFINSSQWN